ncbi:hypothetical protein E2562_022832 [Oryza meyeriana var. granulata]|uniref:Uncharacterized protein n=1 Tax=Oryza meyeriana var. granulata TaxID=110450 RepID=A0A6G1BN97_9ORYZ|nr:hypothetical protein E2562_022832 [Oryza meyeriana var. granulata]
MLQQEPRTDDAVIGKRREDQGRTPCCGLQIAEGRRQSRRASGGTAEQQNRRRTWKTIRRMRVGQLTIGSSLGGFQQDGGIASKQDGSGSQDGGAGIGFASGGPS